MILLEAIALPTSTLATIVVSSTTLAISLIVTSILRPRNRFFVSRNTFPVNSQFLILRTTTRLNDTLKSTILDNISSVNQIISHDDASSVVYTTTTLNEEPLPTKALLNTISSYLQKFHSLGCKALYLRYRRHETMTFQQTTIFVHLQSVSGFLVLFLSPVLAILLSIYARGYGTIYLQSLPDWHYPSTLNFDNV